MKSDLDLLIGRALAVNGTVFERVREGAYLATLPGQHRLTTAVWLIVGDHSLLVEAFFIRRPDENHEEFYGFLVRRNARMYGVAFALDSLGDVYLVGRLPHGSVTPDEIDRVLGCVLTYSDETFDPAIAIGQL